MKRPNLKFVAVSAICISLCSFPVANAALTYATNADKVDGKHAVGSKTSIVKRRGKLVATDSRTGRLPNNIIAKAKDSGRLGGRLPSYYLPKTGSVAHALRADNADNATNAAKLGGYAANQFLTIAGKAADSDKLDGMDSTQFLSVGALGGGFQTISPGTPLPIFSGTSTAPVFTFACNALTSTISAAYPTGSSGPSTIFWQGPLGSVLTTALGVTTNTFALPLGSLSDGSGKAVFSWHDAGGVYQENVAYAYSSSSNSCSVLTTTLHTR